MRKLLPVVIALLATGVAALPAPAGSPPPRKNIAVRDDLFAPKKLTVKRGTTIAWHWAAQNFNLHDVKLIAAPKGVKHFHSRSRVVRYSFSRKLTVRGTY